MSPRASTTRRATLLVALVIALAGLAVASPLTEAPPSCEEVGCVRLGEGEIPPADAEPGGGGWWWVRFDHDASGLLLVDLHVERIGLGSPYKGAALLTVLDATHAPVGRFTVIGRDGGFDVHATAGGDRVEAPAVLENRGGFFSADYLLGFDLPAGEHTIVLAAAAAGPFGAHATVFVPETAVQAEASGNAARLVEERDFTCDLRVVAAVPATSAQGSNGRLVRLQECGHAFVAEDALFGLVSVSEPAVRLVDPVYGVTAPDGAARSGSGEILLVENGAPGPWTVRVQEYGGIGRFADAPDVSVLVADVALDG